MRWLVLLAVVACGSASKPDSGTATTTDTSTEHCWTTPPAECEAAGCAPILGRPMDLASDPVCVDFGVDGESLGCQPRNTGCPAVESAARPPGEGGCWWFGGCVPDGWEPCGLEIWEDCG